LTKRFATAASGENAPEKLEIGREEVVFLSEAGVFEGSTQEGFEMKCAEGLRIIKVALLMNEMN
jgi:hypothetical protein